MTTIPPEAGTMPPAASFFPQPGYNPAAALCFVHVAKAAGTSVRLTIENPFPGDLTYPTASRATNNPYSKPWNAVEAGDNFHQFKAISAHAGAAIGELLAPDANVFTWLREPEDRVVSAFFFFVVQERQSSNQLYISRLDAGERVETVLLDWLANPEVDFHSQRAQLAYGIASNRSHWRARHPGIDVTDAALRALSRSFFIGLMEDHERSLDALCALTSILPPASPHRRNSGKTRPKRVNFTKDEQARFDEMLAPDRAFYALAREIYDRQMAELMERGRTDTALGLIGNRERLRQHILKQVAPSTPVLTTWWAWDPVLGENLDSREWLETNDIGGKRWRWTGNKADTLLYFRLPRRTAFDLRIRLSPATPPEHAPHVTMRVCGEPARLIVGRTPDGAIELVTTISRKIADRLPELSEVQIHTAKMLDEGLIVPYVGTRMLGIAIESITARPVGLAEILKRRVNDSRLVKLARRVLRRLRRGVSSA